MQWGGNFLRNVPSLAACFKINSSQKKKSVSPNIPCQIYYCGIILLQNIKLCRLHHLLSLILIHMSLQLSLHLKQNEGMVMMWENEFSPLSVGGNTQSKQTTRKENAGGSLLLSESWDHKEGGCVMLERICILLAAQHQTSTTERDKPAANKRKHPNPCLRMVKNLKQYVHWKYRYTEGEV